jgi:exopolysaccharide biosynthesis operon protein EpsL
MNLSTNIRTQISAFGGFGLTGNSKKTGGHVMGLFKSTPLGASLVLVAAAGGAMADELDTLQFRASQSFQHDSNIFRLSDQANTQAILGRPERSDTVSTTTVGIKLNKPVGLQRFELGANFEVNKYSRFSSLDFNALSYAAAWRWSLTPSFHGNLTTDRREYIDNTADIQNQGQVNRRTDKATVLDAEYEVDGVWRLLGGVFQRDSKSSRPFVFQGDSKITGNEVGFRYQFPYATSLAYRFKNSTGEYSNNFFPGIAGSDFKDREHEVRGEWRPGGRSTLNGRISHFARKHDTLPLRDFSGVTGQLDWNYEFTGKTSAAAGIVREIGSYQTNNASYFQGTRVFVAPKWNATEKITLLARYDYGIRDFKGPLPGFAATDRRDRLQLASFSAEYQALRELKLRAWVQQDKRKSNEFGADYKSNAVGVSAEASF